MRHYGFGKLRRSSQASCGACGWPSEFFGHATSALSTSIFWCGLPIATQFAVGGLKPDLLVGRDKLAYCLQTQRFCSNRADAHSPARSPLQTHLVVDKQANRI